MMGRVSLKTRNDKELITKFPEFMRAITSLTANVVLDGEIVILTDGVPDFQRCGSQKSS